jgi:serine/threonine protein kinase
MGVLLYALLCGCLPFDDSSNNMAVIYRKIQSGRFAVPKWLSSESIDVLHDLMQVDPRRRVTVRELVRHPWVVKGYGHSVMWQATNQVKPLHHVNKTLNNAITCEMNLELFLETVVKCFSLIISGMLQKTVMF